MKHTLSPVSVCKVGTLINKNSHLCDHVAMHVCIVLSNSIHWHIHDLHEIVMQFIFVFSIGGLSDQTAIFSLGFYQRKSSSFGHFDLMVFLLCIIKLLV